MPAARRPPPAARRLAAGRWRDPGHLERATAAAGGQEASDAAVAAMLDDARGWRLAEMRKRRGMTQEQVTARMGDIGRPGFPDRTRRRPWKEDRCGGQRVRLGGRRVGDQAAASWTI
jgi:hypothetical protein